MKKCPFCAEEIQDEAVFCRYCRHDLPITQPNNESIIKPPVLKKPKDNWWWPIVILLAIGLSIVLFSNKKPKNTPVMNTPTAVAVTNTPAPTKTPSWILYATDFSSNDGEWLERQDKVSDFDIVNGRYKIRVDEMDVTNWANISKSFSDGILEVDLITGSSDISENTGYYITWRQVDEDNHYGMAILGNGEVYVHKMEDDKNIELYSSNPGLVSFNKPQIPVIVVFIYSNITIYIDDQLITSFDDSTFSEGEIGVGVLTDETNGATVAYDNFTVYSFDAVNSVLPESRVTPTPQKIGNASCSPWSEITLSDVGKTMCVYGKVVNSYFQEQFRAFIFLYSSDPHALYLIKHEDVYWEDVVGRCVKVTGKIKKYYQTPYIEISDDYIYLCD